MPDLAGWRRQRMPTLPDAAYLELDGDTYRLLKVWRDEAHVRAEPFDAIEIALADLWAR